MPSDAQTGIVSVKVLEIPVGTSFTNFTVTQPPPPSPIVSSFMPNIGAVGASVTIRGQNFSDTPTENTVTFGGGAVAMPSVASTTSLTVQVPEGAQTGRISVKVGGRIAVSGQRLTVEAGIFSTTASEGEIRVYPNPTSGELYFVNLSHNSTYMYKLYSLLGQEMRSDVLRGSTIDVSDLEEGQYILVLWSEESAELLRTRLLILR